MENETLQNGAGPDAPVSEGSVFMGIVGALLGGTAGVTLCFLLMYATPSPWNELTFLPLFLVGTVSCLGYRLFRGLRSMRFARNAVRICTVLSVVPGLMCSCVVVALLHGKSAGGTFRAMLTLFQDRKGLVGLGGVLFLVLLGMPLGFNLLLRYADPAWHKDPRRLARVGGGGATFNMLPRWPLPLAAHIPETFTTGADLTVEGDTITVKGRTPRTFSVEEVAGVVLGVSSGYNILYDQNNAMLAKFAWSRKNALLLGQYLLQHGVPFVDLNGNPVPTSVEEPTVPDRFTVREGKVCLILGCVCAVLFGILAVVCVLFWEDTGTLLLLVDIFLFFPLGVWPLLSYRNRRLEADGEQFTYTTAFGRTTRFRLEDIANVAWGMESCKVTDREGKVLARFEGNMENADLLAACLDRHMREKERN